MSDALNYLTPAKLDAIAPPENFALQNRETSWHPLVAIDDLPLEQATPVACDGRSLFIYRSAQAIHVYDSSCPHQSTYIPFLALQGTKLTCPKHHWEFDITDGSCTEAEVRCALKEWPNKVEDGQLLALW